METLKKLFPLSFQAKDMSQLIIDCLIYLVAYVILGFVMGILIRIPLLGYIFTLVLSLITLYIVAGLTILFLYYFKILK